VRAMEAKETRGEVINLGNPDERTVLELAAIVRELTDSSSPIVHRPYEVGDDPQCRKPDISKARLLLGWEPFVELRDGLQRTIAYLNPLVLPADDSAVNGHANGHANGLVNGDANGHVNGDANGHANGHVNGHANGDSNGHAAHDGTPGMMRAPDSP
jgi:hypothetical protein